MKMMDWIYHQNILQFVESCTNASVDIVPSSLIKRRNVSFTATKWFVLSYFGCVSLNDTMTYTRQVNEIGENQNSYKMGKQMLGKLILTFDYAPGTKK